MMTSIAPILAIALCNSCETIGPDFEGATEEEAIREAVRHWNKRYMGKEAVVTTTAPGAKP